MFGCPTSWFYSPDAMNLRTRRYRPLGLAFVAHSLLDNNVRILVHLSSLPTEERKRAGSELWDFIKLMENLGGAGSV